ncbi:type II toxin-antitoxin system HicB family antitoxin [Paraburkholderia nemoris]|uniref:type II toxin-antitoxin system HicB family antitoxin n=1 Tax=Paraburkholderia nemoris TaxID=2793076 RepID=UPI0038BDFE24
MMISMAYEGYFAQVKFDPRENIFVGHVLGISDRTSFHGETVTELTDDFRQAVDHYLEDCAKSGCDPQIPHPAK